MKTAVIPAVIINVFTSSVSSAIPPKLYEIPSPKYAVFNQLSNSATLDETFDSSSVPAPTS